VGYVEKWPSLMFLTYETIRHIEYDRTKERSIHLAISLGRTYLLMKLYLILGGVVVIIAVSVFRAYNSIYLHYRLQL